MNSDIFEKYCQFIRVINQRLNEHFNQQKEYIYCKEGCSLCCSNGQYPCTELEFEFIQIGFFYLDSNLKNKIFENIEKIKKEKEDFKGRKFQYVCPFLINNRCSIYNFRPLICRVFGLSYYEEGTDEYQGKKVIQIPFCVQEGLNYSEVYNEKIERLSMDLYKQKGFKNEPLSTNLSPKFLREKVGKDLLDFEFGEEKPLIEWF